MPQDNWPESEEKDPKLVTCKHCGTAIASRDIQLLPKKFIGDRQTMWGAMEKQYIRINRVNCPNPSCGKKYSVKVRVSDWIYA